MNRAELAAHLGKKPRKSDEDAFQIAVIEHLKWRAVPGVVWYMIRNHGKRSVGALRKDAAMGLRKGAADLGFVLPPTGMAAFLELKVPPNDVEPDQETFGMDVSNSGAFYAVAYNIDQALTILEAWGAIKPEAA